MNEEIKNPNIIIFKMIPMEAEMINFYRQKKDFIKPGHIAFHFDKDGNLRKKEFTGYEGK